MTFSMNNASKIFDRLVADGKNELDRLIAENATEHLFLDFKSKNDSDGSTPLHRDDRKNLSEALSGFSNSQGGVVVWGMDKPKEGVLSYKLVKNPKLLCESLNQATSEVVIPYVDGVRHEIIYEADNKGVVATYVPESEKAPHTTHVGGGLKYYIRSGDSFRQMEHFQIEDMFGRRSRPKLSLTLRISLASESKPHPTYRLTIDLHNEGRAISQNYGFDLDFPTNSLTEQYMVLQRPSCINHTGALTNGFGVIKYRNIHDQDNSPIFPNETITLCPSNYKLGHINFILSENQIEAWKDYPLRYSIYSENMRTEVKEIKFGDLFE